MAALKKTPITTLFLDIGGVLATNGWGKSSRKLAAEKFHLDFDEMESRHRLTFDTYEIGKISLKEYLDRVIFYEKRNFTPTAFRQFMFAQSQPFPDMLQLIRSLKTKYDLKIAVVSNEGRELNAHRIHAFKLNTFVDFYVSSSFVHLRKPDIDIYKLALDLAQVHPKHILYLEDRPLFVEIAQSLGINGLLHTNTPSTQKKLASFGLK